ncbi:hypothetical protein FRB94_008429 [Tulasnella sp. JGI-2019a]|nr:hypothetical protein FRB93_007261 [Tulasnella sp. JGI-2019a]KAG8996280.1 hypothetical protein FRB94_008429 [Tulasnella sp. JGI-2019a]KAG9030982.1 hypothetical protein FRB95_003262 [Tulasnella sp. JGI-2019a]
MAAPLPNRVTTGENIAMRGEEGAKQLFNNFTHKSGKPSLRKTLMLPSVEKGWRNLREALVPKKGLKAPLLRAE